MQKTRLTLEHFFTKPVLDTLLPHIINAERTPLHGTEKHTYVIQALTKQLREPNITIAHEGNNISVPWRILFPIIINAIIQILNIIMGKEWIKEEGAASAPPMS